MRMILVVGLIIASAGLSSAQVSNVRTYRFTGRTEVSLQAVSGETRPNGAYLRNVTLTIGDVVVTADDAVVTGTGGNAEIQLGANARMRIPSPTM